MKKLLLSAVVLILISILGGSFYLIDYSLSKGEFIPHDSILPVIKSDNPQIVSWLDSIQSNNSIQEINRKDSAGHNLHALYIASPDSSANTALLIHGYHCEALSMLKIGYIYNEKLHFNVLLPDLRAHGKSDGNTVQMGWFDRKDVQDWIEYANNQLTPNTNIIVHGISMGAATTMMLSGEKLPSNVRCFIEDCGYTSVYEEFTGELKNQFSIPEYPMMPIASQLNKLINGWSFEEASALEQVKKCKLPMLFIHGDSDTFVPSYMVNKLYDAKPEPKELWITKGVEHDRSFETYPDEYIKKVSDFCNKHMK